MVDHAERGHVPASGRRPMMSGIGTVAMLAACAVLVGLATLRWRDIGLGGLLWLVLFVAMTAIRLPHAARNRANAVVHARSDATERALLLGMFATMMVLPLLHLATGLFGFADYRLPGVVTAAGAIMLLPTLWLFWRSHADLGRNWSPGLELHAEHRLVTDGVYARWRHPMYVAIWLAVLIQPLLIHNVIAGALAIPAFAAMWTLRVPREEAMMRKQFGTRYDIYAARVGRLWPATRS